MVDKLHKGFSKLSLDLTKDIDKDIKKNSGIFFTPPATISTTLQYLKEYNINFNRILEPSCGSCEFITQINKLYPTAHITGIELNQHIFNSIKSFQSPNVELINIDFLNFNTEKTFDVIIGNPPYSVIKKDDINAIYYNYFEGRPNLFIIFIIKSLKMLSKNGVLSFIIPRNFMNCLYYEKTRKYINENFEILKIVNCNDKYIETQQDTVLIIIENKKPNDKIDNKYVLKINEYIIFGSEETIIKLKKLYVNTTTLSDMGFNTAIGSVVWNQCKKILTDDESKTRLIYSSDINNETYYPKDYSNTDKKNYINKTGYTKPILIVNRGYGTGVYDFKYCIINENTNKEYLIENHLMYIIPPERMSMEESILEYKKIIQSFDDKRTREFISLYFGNSAINKTELLNIIPIYN